MVQLSPVLLMIGTMVCIALVGWILLLHVNEKSGLLALLSPLCVHLGVQSTARGGGGGGRTLLYWVLFVCLGLYPGATRRSKVKKIEYQCCHPIAKLRELNLLLLTLMERIIPLS